MKILYIAREYGSEKTGANCVMKRNRDALREIIGSNNLLEHYIPKISKKLFILSFLQLESVGIPKSKRRKIYRKILEFKPDYVFIESSSWGSFYKMLSNKSIKSICFAHNLDTSLTRQKISFRSLFSSIPIYLLTRFNERRTLKYADKLICLNDRDSNDFYKTFRRKADIILPITFPEKKIEDLSANNKKSDNYYIFVGSDFFPNVKGISWFIKNVAPFVKCDFHIVGSCCTNKSLKNITCPSNVKLIGYAEDLDAEYKNSVGVIAPIFQGSGMKTKTIEALSYGKSVYGSDEAFAGIICDFEKIGGLCNTAEEFIECLNSSDGNILNKYSLQLFNNYYSNTSFIKKLQNFLVTSKK